MLGIATMKMNFGMPARTPIVVAYWHPHHINLKKLLQFLAMKGDLTIHQLATGAPWVDLLLKPWKFMTIVSTDVWKFIPIVLIDELIITLLGIASYKSPAINN